VIREFDQLTTSELPAINSSLRKKKLEPIIVLTQEQWDKMHAGDSGGQPGEAMRGLRERD
jgi:hypothetical protein